MRTVVDVNIFVSAFINTAGAPSVVVDAWLDGRFTLILSNALRDEIRDVASRPQTARYFRATADAVATVLANLDHAADLVVPDPVVVVNADPDDDMILGTATADNSDYIVTGDRHLLALGSFRGIPIVTPHQFLRILDVEAAEASE